MLEVLSLQARVHALVRDTSPNNVRWKLAAQGTPLPEAYWPIGDHFLSSIIFKSYKSMTVFVCLCAPVESSPNDVRMYVYVVCVSSACQDVFWI